MPHRVTLEVLDAALPRGTAADATVVLSADALEDAKLAAFEKGYQAGWDDATAAQQEDDARLRRQVEQNLQALSFTFHEAKAHVLRGLGPLIEQICARVLPETARAALGGLVAEALAPLAAEAAERPVTIRIHPSARRPVAQALAGAVGPPHEIVEDAALAPGEVLLAFDGGERRIDIDAAATAIARAVASHFHQEQELKAHG